ncbi:hypothetical protein Mgra_00004588 [Meloidogyne graminicola]|uniref:AAA+ ATPase domain-containing protein n=1 Tax=Meloidogyne graminicola TaxID=189291 RepID=A0A8S9ZSJ7_9BILA|nr:hypothetical protein Mgra_00004588 [Meloidogyne graminicola]
MDSLTFSDKDFKFKLPFGMIISGPSSSGKTTFLLKFISESNELIYPKPKSILYCFGEMNMLVPVLQKSGVNVLSGVPSEEQIKNLPKPLLLILDDLLLSIDEKYLSELFTKKSHHQNFAIIFVTQNLFERKIKVARQNSQYIVLMRSPNAMLSIRNIGVQLFPRQLDYFLDAYKQATSQPYGYLLIDMHASSDPLLRLRTNIFKEDTEKIFFISKNGRFRLTTRQKKRLIPYAEFVRHMSRVRSERGARHVLTQKGGGVGVFAALLTPVLLEMAKSIYKSNTTTSDN